MGAATSRCKKRDGTAGFVAMFAVLWYFDRESISDAAYFWKDRQGKQHLFCKIIQWKELEQPGRQRPFCSRIQTGQTADDAAVRQSAVACLRIMWDVGLIPGWGIACHYVGCRAGRVHLPAAARW